MDEIVDIVRQIGRQQSENLYYRACYGLLKRLQELIDHAAEELLRNQQSDPPDSPSRSSDHAYGILRELQGSMFDLVDQACGSQSSCEEFCPIDHRFSARHVFPRRDPSPVDHLLVEPLSLHGAENAELPF